MEAAVSVGAYKLIFATLRRCQSSFATSGEKFYSAADKDGCKRLNQTERRNMLK